MLYILEVFAHCVACLIHLSHKLEFIILTAPLSQLQSAHFYDNYIVIYLILSPIFFMQNCRLVKSTKNFPLLPQNYYIVSSWNQFVYKAAGNVMHFLSMPQMFNHGLSILCQGLFELYQYYFCANHFVDFKVSRQHFIS